MEATGQAKAPFANQAPVGKRLHCVDNSPQGVFIEEQVEGAVPEFWQCDERCGSSRQRSRVTVSLKRFGGVDQSLSASAAKIWLCERVVDDGLMSRQVRVPQAATGEVLNRNEARQLFRPVEEVAHLAALASNLGHPCPGKIEFSHAVATASSRSIRSGALMPRRSRVAWRATRAAWQRATRAAESSGCSGWITRQAS